jgi:GH35 family endo-1,4-beta-xylanase
MVLSALALATMPVLCLVRSLHRETLGYAMHTLDGDGSELALVEEAGFGWVVQVFSWREIARWRQLYDWERPDAVVRGAEYYGLNVVARLDQHPDWARSKSATNGPPDDLADYGDFVHAVASRYKGRIKAYVIWNEPNLAAEWGNAQPDPEAYVEMLKVAYTSIKEADPGALVVSAGLSPTNERSELAMDDRLYLERLYQAGASGYFDVLGAHAYGFAYAPDDPRDAHQGLNMARVQDLREIMVAHGDANKPVWITELGWTTAPPEEEAWQQVSLEAQANYLVGAFRMAREEWPWIQLITVWNLGLGVSAEDEGAGYCLLDSSDEPKPAYHALAEMPKGETLAALWRMLRTQHQAVASTAWDGSARALAEDVIIHLGDNHWPTPWLPLHQGQLPSPVWTGQFYLRDPGEAQWSLHIEVMQNNERTNYVLVNGHPLEPPYLPTEDYSRSWVSVDYQIPAGYLQPGVNEITVVVGKQIPARHQAGTYEDLQFRDVSLERS